MRAGRNSRHRASHSSFLRTPAAFRFISRLLIQGKKCMSVLHGIYLNGLSIFTKTTALKHFLLKREFKLFHMHRIYIQIFYQVFYMKVTNLGLIYSKMAYLPHQ